jgi:carbon monoxide dehydrogenase subunit G
VKVQGERAFAAPRETVWRVLQDPAQMAEVMPGVESFDVDDDRHWRANVAIPLGLGSLRMSINFEKLEEREPEFSQLRAKGTGVGALMNLITQFELSERDGGTAMAWEADVRIAGPVGSMGQRVLKPIVNQQVQQVLTALDAQVTKVGESEAPKGAEEGLSPLEEESYSDER